MFSVLTQGRVVVAAVAALIAGSAYAVIIYPMTQAKEYMKIQDEVRKNMNREEIQPGGMKMWSDPFKDQVKETPLYMQKPKKE